MTGAHVNSFQSAEDQRLLQFVRPAEWKNPTPRGRYHLVVVGAGSAGLVTAVIAAGLGASVALIERNRMGGDCLNFGCVPSKALIAAGRAWVAARSAREEFGGPAAAGEGDFAVVMERMRQIRASIAPIDSAERFRGLGVDVFLGEGHFVAPDAIEVDSARLHFRKAVIAAGGRPAIPPIPGLDDAGFLTNETIFDLDTLPRRLLVIGGGPVGCELAQSFARFGTEVTLIEQSERLLPNEDANASAIVAAALRRDGVDVRTGARVTAVESVTGGKRVRFVTGSGSRAGVEDPGTPTTREIDADEILVATGRKPNVEGLALEAAEIATGPAGIAIDDRLRTSNPRVYAIGDIVSTLNLTHLADAHARLVVRNALFNGRRRHTSLVVPRCTYTSPEVAHVGISAAEVTAAPETVDTITIPLEDVDRALLDGTTEGFFRVHLRRGSDRILGATLVSERAGDLISQVTAVITAGLGLSALGEVVFPYPTVAEVFRKAADARARERLTPFARRVLGLWLR